MVIVEWTLAISLFWFVAALFLGGAPIRIEGGGAIRELAGLLLSFVVFLVIWSVLKSLLSGLLPGGVAFILSTAVSCLLLPLMAVASLRLLGVRVRLERRAEEHAVH